MNLNAVETVGTIGGSMIALSLLPQVIYTFKTKSAGDISYLYQAIYIAGTTLVNLYAILLGLWPVYVPCLLEESLIVSLTIMKVLYDRKGLQQDLQIDINQSFRWSARRTESVRDLSQSARALSESCRNLAASGRSSSTRGVDLLDEVNKSWQWGRPPPSSKPTEKDGLSKSTGELGERQLKRDASRLKQNRWSTTREFSIYGYDIESGGGDGEDEDIGDTTGSRFENICNAVGRFFDGKAILEDMGKGNIRKRHSWTL
ncbi:hypothetical protein ACHAXT_012405 [Thalassiosira profunda]